MDEPLRLIVYRSKTLYDDIIVTPSFAIRCEEICERDEVRENERQLNVHRHFQDFNKKYERVTPIRLNKKGCNAYLVSIYVITLKKSDVYRKAAINKLLQIVPVKTQDIPNVIFVKLRTPKKQFLDYKWNEKIIYMVLERQDADHALSWLSTLGGAFSALGDDFHDCAKIAGKISVRQFQLALRLGNPLLVARCKLYAALSLIQRGHFKTPKCMIKKIHKYAVRENDTRLQNMCHGVWAKLKYSYELHKKKNIK